MPTPRKQRQASVPIRDVLPLSQAGLEVYRMSRDEDCDSESIAAAIQQDPGLTVELLQVGNSIAYRRTSEPVKDLEKIVVNIGRRKVGELALAFSTLASLEDISLPGCDVDLMLRRSSATGAVMQILLGNCKVQVRHDGLTLTAILHQLGRMVIAARYPDEYQSVLDAASASSTPLGMLEKQAFGSSHSELLCDLLIDWQLPEDVVAPLRHFDTTFEEIAELPQMMRNSVALLKTAACLGWLAVDRWDPADTVDLPPRDLIRSMGAHPVTQILADARQANRARAGLETSPDAKPSPHLVNFLSVCSARFDLLAPLLPSLGLKVQFDDRLAAPLVMNCLNASSEELYGQSPHLHDAATLVFSYMDNRREFPESCEVVALPCSHGHLQQLVTTAISRINSCALP